VLYRPARRGPLPLIGHDGAGLEHEQAASSGAGMHPARRRCAASDHALEGNPTAASDGEGLEPRHQGLNDRVGPLLGAVTLVLGEELLDRSDRQETEVPHTG
jgi:hypothetical protein